MPATVQGVSLAGLLHQLARDVVSTQSRLDESFVSARALRGETEKSLNPVWYRLANVRIALELETLVRDAEADAAGQASPELICRLPNPVSVALYGRAAVTGTCISVEIAPIVPRFRL